MDPIKEAFSKIKEDISSLKDEINTLKSKLTELQTIPLNNLLGKDQQTNRQTQNNPIKPQFTHETSSSTGNRGVPTDRPTNQQTDQQTQNNLQKTSISSHNLEFKHNISNEFLQKNLSDTQKDPISEFARANYILNTLDDIKKEIRLKFKGLTNQEMLVFNTLYRLEEQKIEQITYRTLAEQLSLSESSIRDYINKLTKKGIPISKIRQNNKTILLKISQDLKNIASLRTICQLRDL